MKRNLLTVLVLVGVGALLYAFATPLYRQGEPSPVGKPAHDFAFQMNGRETHLSDLRGRLVVLNFWATWCPPCVAETASLNNLQQWLAPRGGMVLGVSLDDDDSVYQDFLTQHGVIYPTWRAPSNALPLSYGTSMYPETYIIDRQGVIVRKIIGEQKWDSPNMLAYFKSQLSR